MDFWDILAIIASMITIVQFIPTLGLRLKKLHITPLGQRLLHILLLSCCWGVSGALGPIVAPFAGPDEAIILSFALGGLITTRILGFANLNIQKYQVYMMTACWLFSAAIVVFLIKIGPPFEDRPLFLSFALGGVATALILHRTNPHIRARQTFTTAAGWAFGWILGFILRDVLFLASTDLGVGQIGFVWFTSGLVGGTVMLSQLVPYPR